LLGPIARPRKAEGRAAREVGGAGAVSSEKLTQSGLLRDPLKVQSQFPWLESDFQVF